MKSFILGCDGLDYNLVEKWNLQNLKQEVYGKISVPINKQRGLPTSPEVWASFLTGKQVLGLELDRIGLAGKVLNIIISLRKKINLSLGIGKPFRRKARIRTFPKLKMSTFIDIPEVSEINAPFYSYDHTVLSAICQFGNNEISMQQAINKILEIYGKRKEQILRETKKKLRKSKVVFAYIHFPDVIQHFLFIKPLLVKKHYVDLDNYVLNLKKILNDDIMFIIISDHGFDLEKGTHSIYGFFSSNNILNPMPERITDFYNIILDEISHENRYTPL